MEEREQIHGQVCVLSEKWVNTIINSAPNPQGIIFGEPFLHRDPNAHAMDLFSQGKCHIRVERLTLLFLRILCGISCYLYSLVLLVKYKTAEFLCFAIAQSSN